MEILLDRFPIFEANQVLMSGHLNNVFDYLDQQTRLTRSHLVGIGIVCGFELRPGTKGDTIVLGKGCGVTSEGYLIMEPEDVTLTSYRKYQVPAGDNYPPFKRGANDYVGLWELTPAGEVGTTPLNTEPTFLIDKVVVLFLEVKHQALRNCSPNNCDDKGSMMVATLRRLLIERSNIDKIIAQRLDLGSNLTSADIDAMLSKRLNLPDLRQRRFDVNSSQLVSTADVYRAFLGGFSKVKLVRETANALKATYAAFRPLLEKSYPTDPFSGFLADYGFLDDMPQTAAQVRFLQYYRDFFDDILLAYDEFRQKGSELLCTCCPPRDLFPRHLMLGEVVPLGNTGNIYRQHFLPSPAASGCESESRALLSLFTRLVELIKRFTNEPERIGSIDTHGVKLPIRVTPSVHGRASLGVRAIPYYYAMNGQPPLYHLWDITKTRRNRANQNFGYRSSTFLPKPPAFITEPLDYDLEPNNFLRIEGHLSKNYVDVLKTLDALRQLKRLPIDIIALRTGPYDPRHPVDLSKQQARFADLETLYDSLREQLLAALCEGTREIYDMPVSSPAHPGGSPKNALLRSHAPGYTFSANTLGAWFEAHIQLFSAASYIDVDQTSIDYSSVLNLYCTLLNGVSTAPSADKLPYGVALYYFMQLAAILPDSLSALVYSNFENRCQDLLALLRYFRREEAKKVPADLQAFLPRDDLIDLCEDVLFNCQLGPINAVHQEYLKRIDEIRKLQFLSTFLEQHPGIDHKAGVPLGGTFIIVYHAKPIQVSNPGSIAGEVVHIGGNELQPTRILIDNSEVKEIDEPQHTPRSRGVRAPSAERFKQEASMLASDQSLASLLSANVKMAESWQVLYHALKNLRLELQVVPAVPDPGSNVPPVIIDTIKDLADGTVIADFYLPYRIASGGPSIEFVLPKPAPSLDVKLGCTDGDGIAQATVTVRGGKEPYELSVDSKGYVALTGPILITSGTHVLRARDSEGTETPDQTIVVPQAISIDSPTFQCENEKYRASFKVSGGTSPYTVNGKQTSGNFVSDPVPSGTEITIKVTDYAGCVAEQTFKHDCPKPCTLPCKGHSRKRNYVFWMPHPQPNNPYREIKVDKTHFLISYDETAPEKTVDMSNELAAIIEASESQLTAESFTETVQNWMTKINDLIKNRAELANPDNHQWLALEYEKSSTDGFGTLRIEHFKCLGFEIIVFLTLSFKESEAVSVRFVYTHDHSQIEYGNVKTKIPPMDGVTWNKCDPASLMQPLCPSPVNFELQTTFNVDGNVIPARVTSAVDNLTYLWEAPACTPRFGVGSNFWTRAPGPGTHRLFVRAIDKYGCTDLKAFEVNTLG